MTDDKLDMAALLDMANAFRKSRILLTGLELGVFMALGEAVRGGATGLSSADLATRLGTEPRYTDRLLNALVALGLLEKEAVGSEQGAVSNGSRAGGALSDGLSAPGPTRPTGPTSLTSPTPAPAPSDGPTG
ncbi:MAG: hypothetical protein FJ109_19845, partial [Deltaproteobacteria bacterium]|nr:hypothetical protein [Deltaproteobacteria bacterium]